jgi:hypothetical protein
LRREPAAIRAARIGHGDDPDAERHRLLDCVLGDVARARDPHAQALEATPDLFQHFLGEVDRPGEHAVGAVRQFPDHAGHVAHLGAALSVAHRQRGERVLEVIPFPRDGAVVLDAAPQGLIAAHESAL